MSHAFVRFSNNNYWFIGTRTTTSIAIHYYINYKTSAKYSNLLTLPQRSRYFLKFARLLLNIDNQHMKHYFADGEVYKLKVLHVEVDKYETLQC